MKTNVALIGFMGVGKSATGNLLAKRLNKIFVEVDALIEQKAGKSITAIFEENGEITFRELEIETIKEIAVRKNQVISCGGGVVLNQINIDRLKQDSFIIWLTASPSAISKRTELNGEIRPLLKGSRNQEDIRLLLKTRKPFYERVAEIVINTTKIDTKTVVDQIIEKLESNADYC